MGYSCLYNINCIVLDQLDVGPLQASPSPTPSAPIIQATDGNLDWRRTVARFAIRRHTLFSPGLPRTSSVPLTSFDPFIANRTYLLCVTLLSEMGVRF